MYFFVKHQMCLAMTNSKISIVNREEDISRSLSTLSEWSPQNAVFFCFFRRLFLGNWDELSFLISQPCWGKSTPGKSSAWTCSIIMHYRLECHVTWLNTCHSGGRRKSIWFFNDSVWYAVNSNISHVCWYMFCTPLCWQFHIFHH